MGYRRGRAAICLAIATLLICVQDRARAGDAIDLTDPNWVDPFDDADEGPYISVESFPLPTLQGLDAALLAHLSDEIGVDGTTIAGIRLKVGLPAGYTLESIEVAAADAAFLVKDRAFLRRVGDFFTAVARFLLLGRIVSAGSRLEIPAQAWYVLFETTPLGDASVTLHTKDDVRSTKGDANLTHHGAFTVCRYLIAVNAYSELVNVRITGRNPATHDVVRYHVPRMKLPLLPPREDSSQGPTVNLSARFDLEAVTGP